MKNQFYTYAYLREDGTPYYIGKGKGYRMRYKHRQGVKVPPLDRIIVLKKNLTEEEAFRHEVYMIAVLGRKDLGTGLLRNITSGGEGTSGWKAPLEWREAARQRALGRRHTEEARRKIGEKHKGKTVSEETREKIKENNFRAVGYFWITNGVAEKWVEPETNIPEGWVKGRKPVDNETKEKMRKSTSGEKNPMFGVKPKSASMKWFNLDNKLEKMFVLGEEPNGWQRGRVRKVRETVLAPEAS